jgi:hypothetical protein
VSPETGRQVHVEDECFNFLRTDSFFRIICRVSPVTQGGELLPLIFLVGNKLTYCAYKLVFQLQPRDVHIRVKNHEELFFPLQPFDVHISPRAGPGKNSGPASKTRYFVKRLFSLHAPTNDSNPNINKLALKCCGVFSAYSE